MEFSYCQTENFEMEKLSSDTGYFKKPLEINRGLLCYKLGQKFFKSSVLMFFLEIIPVTKSSDSKISKNQRSNDLHFQNTKTILWISVIQVNQCQKKKISQID